MNGRHWRLGVAVCEIDQSIELRLLLKKLEGGSEIGLPSPLDRFWRLSLVAVLPPDAIITFEDTKLGALSPELMNGGPEDLEVGCGEAAGGVQGN